MLMDVGSTPTVSTRSVLFGYKIQLDDYIYKFIIVFMKKKKKVEPEVIYIV